MRGRLGEENDMDMELERKDPLGELIPERNMAAGEEGKSPPSVWSSNASS